MPKTITLADLSGERAHVELFDHTYLLREVVRSVQKRLEKVDANLKTAVDTDDSDAIVAAMIEGLDVLLEPNGTNGPPIKKLLTDAWKTDKLSTRQLNVLYENLQDAAASRPT